MKTKVVRKEEFSKVYVSLTIETQEELDEMVEELGLSKRGFLFALYSKLNDIRSGGNDE